MHPLIYYNVSGILADSALDLGDSGRSGISRFQKNIVRIFGSLYLIVTETKGWFRGRVEGANRIAEPIQ